MQSQGAIRNCFAGVLRSAELALDANGDPCKDHDESVRSRSQTTKVALAGCADLKSRGMCKHSKVGEMSKKLCPTTCGVCVPFGEATKPVPAVVTAESLTKTAENEKEGPMQCLSDALWKHRMKTNGCDRWAKTGMATKCPSACLDVLRSFPRTCAVQTKLASAMVVGKVSTMANKCAGKLAPISAEPYKPVTTPSEPLTTGTDTGTSTGSPVKKLWKPVIKRKMKVTSTPVDTAELKHEQSDAIARAKQEQAKAERKAAEAKAHLQAAKALEAEATSKQHLEAAKALEAEATASSDAPITAATDAPVTPAPKEGDEPLTDAPVPPVKKEKTIEFKESPMTMPVPGNLGVVAVHGMKMEPSEGGVPSMEVHLQHLLV